MQIERHVFGSYKGYTTLARSPGVTVDDCRVIERCAHSFGQTYESRYYRSLGKNPAWFTQQYPGNRRGLTRITEGSADDQGRPTLCFITTIVSRRDWDAVILGDIGVMADCRALWGWDDSGTITTLNLEISGSANVPAKVRSVALQVISQMERTAVSKRSVVGSEGEISFDVVRAIEMLLPPPVRNSATTAFRVLSPQFPASLNVLADEVASAASYRPDERQPLSAYAQALKTGGLDSGNVPLSVVAGYGAFGTQQLQSSGSPAGPSVQVVTCEGPDYRTRRLPVIVAGFGGIVAGVMIGILCQRVLVRHQMAARGLVLHEDRWLTNDEADRAEKVGNGLAEHNGEWMSKEQRDIRTKNDATAKAEAAKGHVQYQEKWMSVEDAYRHKQQDENHLVEYGGKWMSKEEKARQETQAKEKEEAEAKEKIRYKDQWLTIDEAYEQQQRNRGLVQYKGGWRTRQQERDEIEATEKAFQEKAASGQRPAGDSSGVTGDKANDDSTKIAPKTVAPKIPSTPPHSGGNS